MSDAKLRLEFRVYNIGGHNDNMYLPNRILYYINQNRDDK